MQDISGRSIDSNMSISPVAGSASANVNPFTAVDKVAAQPAPSGSTFPALFPPAASTASAGPATGFAFGASAAASAASSAPAQDANVKPGLFASAGKADHTLYAILLRGGFLWSFWYGLGCSRAL